MPAKLKVFRTPIGFHDAYVAAPSQKAALAAWGADADLFARGLAEQVTDPELAAAALADPGKVIRVPRGSASEHLAEAARTQPRRTRRPAAEDERKPSRSQDASARVRPARSRPVKLRPVKLRPVKPRPVAPRPSREDLDAAEAELDRLDQSFEEEAQALEAERARIAEKITALRRNHDKRRAGQEKRIEKVRRIFEAAMARWRQSE